MTDGVSDKPVIVLGPDDPVAFSIYRITFGEYVYIGHTQDIHNRAMRHATDRRRKIGQLFLEVEGPMVVIHIDYADTKDEARLIEQAYIKREYALVGDKLLNTHHARPRKK